MFVGLLLALCFSEEREEGTYDLEGKFLPSIPSTVIDGRAYFLDYPGNRVPIQRLVKVISSFNVLDDSVYGLQEIFGQIVNLKDPTDFIWNFTSYGLGGRLSSEDQNTFLHFCELDTALEANDYQVFIWGRLAKESGGNYSLLLYNETTTFYEVVDIKNQVGGIILYGASVGVVAWVLYVIFRKNLKGPTQSITRKSKVRDYGEIHGVSDKESDSTRSPQRKDE